MVILIIFFKIIRMIFTYVKQLYITSGTFVNIKIDYQLNNEANSNCSNNF